MSRPEVPPQVREELDAVAAELEAEGLAENGDFFMPDRPHGPRDWPGSEYVGIEHTDGAFKVWYYDMGRRKDLMTSPSFEEVRPFFVDEVRRVGAAHRRGPLAGKRSPR